MSEPYAHITFGQDRNAERLGAFVAWLVTNNLLEAVFERTVEKAATRVKMQDMTGPEFLTTVLDGELAPHQLSDEGRDFVEAYFVTGQFDSDYALCDYVGENEWYRYDEVSPLVSAAFKQHCDPKPRKRSRAAKILSFPFGRKH
ncbi:MAG: hypothetical protein CMQ29_12365 [Gammaproteobacteria bacterium]|jgi:hypothetical protein|nr:hypothetical protein [Gammaproteobacteria bacterium]|tara:strand:- start:1644 stop:2075 length:432 start_codon:yes stop_codon:yes gene_type:complete